MEIKITTTNGVNLCNIYHIEPLSDSDIEKFAKGLLDAEVTGIDFDHDNTHWSIGNFVILSTQYSLHMITINDWKKIQLLSDEIDRENEFVPCDEGCEVDDK